MMQPRMQNALGGNSVLTLLQFGDHLSQFTVSATPRRNGDNRNSHQDALQVRNQSQQPQSNDLSYWQSFVDRFYSPTGVLRQQLSDSENNLKAWEIPTSALARYYWTHFSSGVQNMQMIMENARSKDLPSGGHIVECAKSSFIYWFADDCHVKFHLYTQDAVIANNN